MGNIRDNNGASISLLFAAGARPTVEAMASVLAQTSSAGMSAGISHAPPADDGWVEILASGLTFDLAGLAPAAAEPAGPFEDAYGFDGEWRAQGHEAVILHPSGNILAGGALTPVVRTMLALAANLVLNLPVTAVGWSPASTLIEPGYFVRIIMNWLSGGAFPALGLTALSYGSDGCVNSRGLSHFTGQEVHIDRSDGQSPAEAIKLAIRVVDFLVRQGHLTAPCTINGAGSLIAEPVQNGKKVWVWRGE